MTPFRSLLFRVGVVALLAAANVFAASDNPRQVISLDAGWRFQLGESAGAESSRFDDGSWRTLNVPHDWSIEGDYRPDHPTGGHGGYLPAGIGWYRRTLELSTAPQQQRYRLTFDGVYMNSTVWVNGTKFIARPYGYLGFGLDVTEALHAGRNVIAVRVDTSLAPSSRWYSGSGIYGHVWLTTTARVHIAPDGVFVRTAKVEQDHAEISIDTEVDAAGEDRSQLTLESSLLEPSGKVVASNSASVGNATSSQRLTVPQPRRWSSQSPFLYSLRTRLLRDGNIIDETNTPFGIRTIEWNAQRGFLLNGEVVKLRGVCEHHEIVPVGAGVPDVLLERRLRQLQSMGVNAIRTAHNPRTPIFYDLCDRLGILVMDEIFDGWRQKAPHDYGARFFKDWWRRDVTDWVRRDRNHPSIVIYSIGNETGTRDEHGISAAIHELDPTRPTTGGQILEGVDVVGLNGPGEITPALMDFRRRYPDRPFVLTEVPHTYQTRGYYRVLSWYRDRGKPHEPVLPYGDEERFSGGDRRYNSSYDNSTIRITARQSWRRTAELPWIAGEFRWTGFDYLGEGGWTAGGWPARSYNHGIIDLAGFPKDTFYFYQSVWTEQPMVHVLPHWTHPGLEGKTIPVVAYANADEVELWLNERSLGRKARGEYADFVWQVPYAPGRLRAVAYRAGKPVCETEQRTAGNPVRLKLTSDSLPLKSDGLDVAAVTIAVTDRDGTLVPSANDRITFRVEGPAQELGYENGDPLDVTPHRVRWRKAFYGLARGFYQATRDNGPVQLTAGAILATRDSADKATVGISVESLALRGEPVQRQLQIRYTVDGSAPGKASPVYVEPFTISLPARVRAVVLRDGGSWFELDETISRRVDQTFTDPRFVGTAGSDTGPWDVEAVGLWQSARRTLDLRAGGTVHELRAGQSVPMGTWWYDWPNDQFEAGGDTGVGEILWKSGANQRIKLRSGDELLLIAGGQNEVLRRKH